MTMARIQLDELFTTRAVHLNFELFDLRRADPTNTLHFAKDQAIHIEIV